jgi:orotate phosphoribosyltransferase
MNSKELLREQILNKAVVHGKVILSSGKEADYYVDLRRVTLDHIAAPLVGEVMLELTKDLDYEAVGGLTLGADPVATAMMHVAASKGRSIDSFVVRKAEKAHGLQRRIEGPDVKGKKVLAVEDTSTTGGSVLTAVEALIEAGAIIVGVAVIVEALTDNKNRTASEVRAAFTKFGGNLGETGSVRFMFDHVGQIIYLMDKATPDVMFEAALDVGADNVESTDEGHEITTTPEGFISVRDALEKKFGEAERAAIIWKPNVMTTVDADTATTILKMVDALEDSDDVQNVITNFEISEEDMLKLAAG